MSDPMILTFAEFTQGASTLIGGIVVFGAFYVFVDTLEHSRRYSPDAGLVRCLLCALAMGGGGLLAVFSIAGL